jgi:hypothetical protein
MAPKKLTMSQTLRERTTKSNNYASARGSIIKSERMRTRSQGCDVKSVKPFSQDIIDPDKISTMKHHHHHREIKPRIIREHPTTFPGELSDPFTGEKEPRHDYEQFEDMPTQVLKEEISYLKLEVAKPTRRNMIGALKRRYENEFMLNVLKDRCMDYHLVTKENGESIAGLTLRRRIDAVEFQEAVRWTTDDLLQLCSERFLEVDEESTWERILSLLWRYEQQVRDPIMSTGALFRNRVFAKGMIGCEDVLFRQVNNAADGKCMFRAFAQAYFDNEDEWVRVVQDAKEIFNWGTEGKFASRLGLEMSDESQLLRTHVSYLRCHLYNEAYRLSITDMPGEFGQAIKDSNGTKQKITILEQLSIENNVWGSEETLQLIADAYDVHIIVHFMDDKGLNARIYGVTRGEAEQTFDGNFPSRGQVHLFYNNDHFTALIPVSQNCTFMQHLKHGGFLDESMVQPITHFHPAALPRIASVDDKAPNYDTGHHAHKEDYPFVQNPVTGLDPQATARGLLSSVIDQIAWSRGNN